MWKLGRPSEFEIQFRAFKLLKDAGYEVRGEVKFKPLSGRSARVDILVLVDGVPTLIVEVKRSRPRVDRFGEVAGGMKQVERYKSATGLPVVIVRPHNVDQVVSIVDHAIT